VKPIPPGSGVGTPSGIHNTLSSNSQPSMFPKINDSSFKRNHYLRGSCGSRLNTTFTHPMLKDSKVISNTLQNRSSVHHNILTGETNPYSHALRLSPKVVENKMTYKKKGITDLFNLQAPRAIKVNLDHD